LPQLRARLFAAIDGACEHGTRTQRDKDLGQADLFGGGDPSGAQNAANVLLPDVAAWTEMEQLQFEKEALGLYWSGHPIDRYADDLRECGARSTADLNIRKEPAGNEEDASSSMGAGSPASMGAGPSASVGAGFSRPGNGNGRLVSEDISIGGIVSALRPLKTRKGDRMCVFTLDDAHGSIEVVVFPDTFQRYGELADNGRMVVVKGKFERDDESARMLASEIMPVDMLREKLTKSVEIHLSTPPHDRSTFLKLWDVLAQHKGDRPIALDLAVRDRQLLVKTDVNPQIRVRPSARLVEDVERVCGEGSVTLR
jgi:DNA polymerase-3 subunit alpha